MDVGRGGGGRSGGGRRVPGRPFEPAGELPAHPWWRDVSQTLSREWPVPELALKTTRGLDLVAEDCVVASVSLTWLLVIVPCAAAL